MKDLKNLEIMPLYSMVMVEMYDQNPYEECETETGLKLTTDTFENPDTGELDKKDFYTATAKVIEVGNKCLYAKPGMDCLIDIRALKPIRFMGGTYFITAEQNITALIAENLKEQLKEK